MNHWKLSALLSGGSLHVLPGRMPCYLCCLMMYAEDTIVALATPPGVGALGIIRLSGPQAMAIANRVFKGKDLEQQASHTLHFGWIVQPADPAIPAATPAEIIDEVVVSLYKAPRSYTGEDVVEISCHGSPFILQQVVDVCVQQGAMPAKPGEFTQRAFFNGKLDLTQAEAVGDLIASQSSSARKAAMHNLRGGFSAQLKQIREELITFSALIELELDFSEEDVAFADRTQLYALIHRSETLTEQLIASFRLGNVVKNGVRVAIIGQPNAGKSTLLNALLNEERAIVSDIAGTTRDTIEEVLNIKGVLFRFIDTAGIREHTLDEIEKIGIERSYQNAEQADLVLHLLDLSKGVDVAHETEQWLLRHDKQFLRVYNKSDIWQQDQSTDAALPPGLFITAKTGEGVEALKEQIFALSVADTLQTESTLVTNARHYGALLEVLKSLQEIKAGMDASISGELIALDIRRCLHYIGEITGEVQTDRDILGAIFGKFCIGK